MLGNIHLIHFSMKKTISKHPKEIMVDCVFKVETCSTITFFLKENTAFGPASFSVKNLCQMNTKENHEFIFRTVE